MSHIDDPATVDASLHLVAGVHADERATVVDHFAPLDARLRSFRADQVQLHLTIKERDTPSQKTTLEAVIAGWAPIVAHSSLPGFDAPVNEVRDELIRRISDAKNKQEPRNNKHLRDTPRHS